MLATVVVLSTLLAGSFGNGISRSPCREGARFVFEKTEFELRRVKCGANGRPVRTELWARGLEGSKLPKRWARHSRHETDALTGEEHVVFLEGALPPAPDGRLQHYGAGNGLPGMEVGGESFGRQGDEIRWGKEEVEVTTRVGAGRRIDYFELRPGGGRRLVRSEFFDTHDPKEPPVAGESYPDGERTSGRRFGTVQRPEPRHRPGSVAVTVLGYLGTPMLLRAHADLVVGLGSGGCRWPSQALRCAGPGIEAEAGIGGLSLGLGASVHLKDNWGGFGVFATRLRTTAGHQSLPRNTDWQGVEAKVMHALPLLVLPPVIYLEALNLRELRTGERRVIFGVGLVLPFVRGEIL